MELGEGQVEVIMVFRVPGVAEGQPVPQFNKAEEVFMVEAELLVEMGLYE